MPQDNAAFRQSSDGRPSEYGFGPGAYPIETVDVDDFEERNEEAGHIVVFHAHAPAAPWDITGSVDTSLIKGSVSLFHPHRQRGRAIQQRPRGPGAFPSGADLEFFSANGESVELFETIPEDNPGGLAVASPVDQTDTSRADLPQAKEIVGSDAKQQKAGQQTKQTTTALVLGAIFLLVVVLFAVFAVVAPGKDSDEPTPSQAPSLGPTEAPTSYETYLMSLLPEHTIMAMEDPESSQSKAFEWLIEDTNQNPFQEESRLLQKYALACFYYSTGGETWRNNEKWLNYSVDECDWRDNIHFAMNDTLSFVYPGCLGSYRPPEGNCDEAGQYQNLWLDTNHLLGTIPEEFYKLTNLKAVSLGLNPLFGTISSRIGQLTSLQSLLFFGQVITGVIPSEIGLLTDLMRRLYFFDSDLSGTIPTEIGQMESLEWLILFGNRISGSISSELGELLRLSLGANELQGTLPKHMGGMTSTTMLEVRGNQLSGTLPSEFGLLTSISMVLDVGDNPLSSTVPTELGLLTGLYDLSLQNCGFTGPIPTEIGLLRTIGEIRLGQNSFSGTVPTELAALQHSLYALNMQGNPRLSGTIPNGLCGINATCIPNALNPCPVDIGLLFDCDDNSLLCGCDCCASLQENGTLGM
ncbi:Leucine Rich Repeat [Seminavis robusta]|uniref:Leucine Rich Repeat n=1 Tax=Seminavis robusta TaxID=568900 RepID=A0A9N8DG99_9STRA|nr:Leucine Rich Repeat [Seminavis robusta]|eukprot:Sro73_g040430.1 Leucine Rich Repeat (637) ;mRNA; r:86669-88975